MRGMRTLDFLLYRFSAETRRRVKAEIPSKRYSSNSTQDFIRDFDSRSLRNMSENLVSNCTLHCATYLVHPLGILVSPMISGCKHYLESFNHVPHTLFAPDSSFIPLILIQSDETIPQIMITLLIMSGPCIYPHSQE